MARFWCSMTCSAFTQGRTPRFVRNFMEGANSTLDALEAYVAAVKDRSYPDKEHCFS
ncbi:MAG: hypothetical protein CM1200mP36_09380 [Gammaproteobacteria bacterium]|nr:MAG: hypothetical protein CM1200mP36_09380 [Gammaproteobacteria bacterium]